MLPGIVVLQVDVNEEERVRNFCVLEGIGSRTGDSSRSIEGNLRALHEYRALYQIPIGAQVIPVWQSSA
jgi:hypothetical protein